MKILVEMRFTLLAASVAITVVLSTILAGIDLIKLDYLESLDFDDLLSGTVIILVGLAIDFSRRRKHHRAEIEAEKLRTLQATMRTVQDIVNNFLNNLQLFGMLAENNMPPEYLDSVQDLIEQTSKKLKVLGDLESVKEKPFAVGIGIDYGE